MNINELKAEVKGQYKVTRNGYIATYIATYSNLYEAQQSAQTIALNTYDTVEVISPLGEIIATY